MKITRDQVRAKLKRIGRFFDKPTGDEAKGLRARAAVRGTFDISDIADKLADMGALHTLLSHCRKVHDRGRRRWMMPDDLRRDELERLAKEGRLQALASEVKPKKEDILGRTLAGLATGQPIRLEKLTPEQLVAAEQASRWLDGLVEGLPDRGEISRRLEVANLLRPLRKLVGTHFRGRQDLLKELHEYVGGLPASTSSESVWRSVMNFVSFQDTPPLFLHGPGGVGKSTLLAHFVLTYAYLNEANRLPFAYLNFDRPALQLEEPVTLLVEAVRQIGIQYPTHEPIVGKLLGKWNEQLARLAGDVFESDTGSEQAYLRRTISDRGPFISEFQSLLEAVTEGQRPFLMILDTFEEVQYRGFDFVEELYGMLNELQGAFPRLRVVIAGRAPMEELPSRNLPVKDFDPEAAEGFTLHLLREEGVNNKALAREIAKRVGGSPLSLKLAVDVVREEGLKGLQDVGGSRFLFFKVSQEVIQGQLYKRILGHIHDDEVVRIAHPGLALRRITKEIIRKVLAEPCGLKVDSDAKAQDLFEKLSREASLVSSDGPNALVHRADVRRVMLPALQREEPERVRQIHENAVDFYRKEKDEAARIEELYHRLALGESAEVLDKRWIPAATRPLEGVIEEFPEKSRAYFASQSGLTLKSDMHEGQDQEAWERTVAHRARQLLQRRQPGQVMELLGERTDRTVGSPLYEIEAQALGELGRTEQAIEVAEKGLESAVELGNKREVAKLSLMLGEFDARTGRTVEALEAINHAIDTIRPLDDKALTAQMVTTLLRIKRGLKGPATPARETVSSVVAEIVEQVQPPQLFSNPTTLQELAGEVGERGPKIMQRALENLGLPVRDDKARAGLAQCLASWDQRQVGRLGTIAKIQSKGDPVVLWEGWLKDQSAKTIGTTLARMLGAYGKGLEAGKVRGAVARIYREGRA